MNTNDATRANAEAMPETQGRTRKESHPADELTFMRRRRKPAGIEYWAVEGTGNYGSDCAKGEELAREFLTYIGEHPTYGNSVLLRDIVAHMAERVRDMELNPGMGSRLTGIEIGFLGLVGRSACAAAKAIGRPIDWNRPASPRPADLPAETTPLSELIVAVDEGMAAINAHEGEPDHPEVVALFKQLNASVLAICGHRPQTRADELRKAEFLRAHYQHNPLSEAEQAALFASLMPKGGAA